MKNKLGLFQMYQLNNIVYLSENENKELLTNELYLTKVIHVDSEKKFLQMNIHSNILLEQIQIYFNGVNEFLYN